MPIFCLLLLHISLMELKMPVLHRGGAFDVKINSINTLIFIFYSSVLVLLFQNQIPSISAYTITPSTPIKDGMNLTSKSGTFELGFFSPSNSENRYLGIWYKTVPGQTIVWVANGDSPLKDSSGVLMILPNGNLVIQNRTNHIIWSTNSSKEATNPTAEFLDSGNLVLRDGILDGYLWESFLYPSDTLLPGMLLGVNLKTGHNTFLRSWKSSDDPSPGDFTYVIELTVYSKRVLLREGNIKHGSKKYYRSGPWNGITSSGTPELKPNPIYRYIITDTEYEHYYSYKLVNKSVISRVMLKQNGNEGSVQRITWVDQKQSWVPHLPIPRDRCDGYAICGSQSICDTTDASFCKCLKGFKPRSLKDWNEMDWSRGCERVTPLECGKGDGFLKFTAVKVPDITRSWMNLSMDLEQCRVNCLSNCSCMAYTNPDIRGRGTGCLMWFGDLLDIRQMMSGDGQDVYIRMAAADLDFEAHSRNQKRLIMILSITLVGGILVLGCLVGLYISKNGCQFWSKIKPKGDSEKYDLELPLFDLITISNATNNFSEENKLGEGGFGPVYKGMLPGGQEIAAKRLSKKSLQGLDEFKNEMILISKVQHRNLVKILGCCIQSEEVLLIYEYMLNGSLDYYLFDRWRSSLLDWKKRFHIILGIARGLLYLHHDSRLRIIHRDLKASNILLDSDLDPKISDFGMARMVGGDQTEAKTNKIVGTHGYMSPEYAVDGHFSTKSDVFSFGVLVLEILSGKRNRGFSNPDHHLNLLGHAWRLWNEDKAIELVDESMRTSLVVGEVLRCIHTGLLCVQQSPHQRPTMSAVLLMLSTDSILLSRPEKPGFYIERISFDSDPSYSGKESHNSNCFTITTIDGR